MKTTLGISGGSPPPILPPKNGDGGGWFSKLPLMTKLLFVVGVIHLILTGAISWFVPSPYKIPSLIILFFVALSQMVVASMKIVREQEKAVLIFFGQILENWDSGLHYALAPFFRVRKMTRNSIQVDFGTLDEKRVQEIQRARQSEKSESWYVNTVPVRISWGDRRSIGALSPEEQERYAGDPQSNTLTTDPHLYYRIRISNLRLLIQEVGGLDEALERIRVTCIRALSEIAGRTFLAKARAELSEISKELLARVEDLVGDPNPNDSTRARRLLGSSWGIDVQEVAIQDIGAPHAVNTALAARTATIAEADSTAIATVRKAEAERTRQIEVATGKAEATRLEAEGEATATERKAKAEKERLTAEGEGQAAAISAKAKAVSEPGGELLIKTEALKEVMTASGGKIVVVPSDLSSLMGTIAGSVETLNILRDKPTAEPKKN